MNDKVIPFDNQKDIEKKLHQESILLESNVSTQVRNKLFKNLALQNKSIPDSKRGVGENKTTYAIAASVLLALLTLHFTLNNSQNESFPEVVSIDEMQTGNTPTTSNNPKITENTSLPPFTGVNSKQKIASMQLNGEYQAILSDIGKLKEEIVKF